MEKKRENIVMFPFMAQGHIIPFLALALQLEQKRDCTITFINTPLNIRKLQSSLPATSSIRLVELPFNSSDHGLPPSTENTNDLSYLLIFRLIQASSSLKLPFRQLISDLVDEKNGSLPLYIIVDMFFGWSVEIAREFGVSHAIFVGGGGFGMACYYSLWLNMPHLVADSDEFAMPDFPEASKLHITQLPENLRLADAADSFGVFLKKEFPEWLNSDGILVNTVEELDKIGLMYFRRKIGRPVWPVGPVLLSMDSHASAGKVSGVTPDLCNKWLDTKPLNSVLYISFGSQNTISESQMMQLAMALEVSCKYFIWVVRPPLGFDINSEFKAQQWLPEGFEHRNQDQKRGLLVQNWAPQVEILSHKSISAFLSHCGWNSVLEALSHGVPLIGWPMAADQFSNVMLLEKEVGVCVEVARGPRCEVKKEEIVQKIELVMNETEKGKEMRRKACEVREMIKNAIRDEEGFKGSSVKAMDEFLNAAILSRREKTKVEKSNEA